MTTLFTPDLLKSFKSNLNINVGSRHISPVIDNHDKNWFQILILEKDSANSENFEAKLVYGEKKNLEKQYKTKLSLPTDGVEIDTSFVSKSDSEFSTVRFLLQCRKLSQILTYTWLNPVEIEEKMKLPIKLIKRILNTYNIIPDTFICSENICLEKVLDIELQQKLLDIEKEDTQFGDFLIKPESMSYSSVPLALLFCGQAYYKDGDQLIKICEPIFSTYESIWEYAIRLSWDTFYATRIDLSQAGLSPKPPYTRVTMGYPPKPNEFNLGENQIKNWVTAKEYFEDSDYPFYPEKATTSWQNKQLEYVIAPYPYIPLSCL